MDPLRADPGGAPPVVTRAEQTLSLKREGAKTREEEKRRGGITKTRERERKEGGKGSVLAAHSLCPSAFRAFALSR